MLAQTLRDLGHVSSKAYPDVWLEAKTKPDGTEYYAYVLVYVDDVLQLHHDPDTLRTAYQKYTGSRMAV